MRSLLSLLLWTAGIASAGEYAILDGGGRLHADHHQVEGDRVLLFNGSGSIELNATQVLRFEEEEYVPPAAEPALSRQEPVAAGAAQALSPQELADRAAEKYGLPPQLVRSVMKAESGFAPEAVSPKGAIGLMQLMPATAATLGANPHDPAANVDAGARYLRELLEKYDGGLRHALAAYNAGPAAVEKYGGVPPYAETVDYIRRVERDFKKPE
jgi:soluble lytic murein transglycosylase-like protein